MAIPEASLDLDRDGMNALAIRYRNGADVLDELIRAGYPLVQVIIRRRRVWLAWGDEDDLIQEGMVGYMEAISSWDPEQTPVFVAWAQFCVRRNVITALKSSSRLKHRLLTDAIHLDAPLRPGEPDPLLAIVRDRSGLAIDPVDRVIEAEGVQEIIDRLSVMSQLERNAVILCLHRGYTYEQAGRILGVSGKSVDNAIVRARLKLQGRRRRPSGREAV